jgi:hypothetical protein
MPERDAWDEVSDRFGRLGKRLRQVTADKPGDGDRDAVTDAFKSFVEALDNAASSLSKAVQDPAFRNDAKAAASSLGDAVAATFTEVGEDLKERFKRS